MKMKFTLLNSLFFLLLSSAAFAQTNGDYRSAVSGDWSAAGTWETYNAGSWVPAGAPPPVGGESIEIRHLVTITTATTIGKVTIDASANLELNGSFIVTLNSDGLSNSGTLWVRTGATLSGPGTVLNNSNGDIEVTLSSLLAVTTTNNGFVTFSQTSGLQSATLTNNNLVTWSDNPLYFLNGATLINNDSMAITVTGPVNVITNSTGTWTNASGAVIYLADPTLNLSVASAVAFTNNGAIHGFGTADFAGTAVGSNGTITPGNGSRALLTVSPASIAGTPTIKLTLSPGGGTPTAGSTYDQLAFTASTNVSGTNMTVTDAAFGDAASTVYTLLTANSGTITGLPTVTLPSSLGNLTNTGTSITVTRLTVLPLNWGSFTVTAGGDQALLAWTTLQENNTSRFTIERSSDGANFTAIGTVAAKGNTSTVSSYSFTDANPSLQGFNYYRLAESDLDGKVNYSLIRVISFGKSNAVIVQTSPNPVKDLLNIVVQDDNITILLSDMSGRTLKTLRLAQGFHQTSIGDLTSGVYQLTIYKGSNKIDSRQILKF